MKTTKIKDCIELEDGKLLVQVPRGTKESNTRTAFQKLFNVYLSDEIVVGGIVAAVCEFKKEYDDKLDKRVRVPYAAYSVGDKVHLNTYCSGEEVLTIDGNEYLVITGSAIQFKYKQQG